MIVKRRVAPPVYRRGTVLVLLAFALVVVLVGVVFSVDVAFVHGAKTELKAACDLAAMAGVESLTRTQSQSLAKTAAKNSAQAHTVGGEPFRLENSDIVLGRHRFVTGGRVEFDAGVLPFTAIQVTGRLGGESLNDPIPSFFGGVFGINEFEVKQISTCAQLDRDLVLVLDISTSMSSSGRFDAMVDAADAFIDEIVLTAETERVMIISYNHSAYTNQVLTENTEAMRDAIDSLEIDDSGTAIGEGLLRATNELEIDPLTRPLAQQVIILMTDGQHNTGIDPGTAVVTAANRHHIVNTITFSSSANQADMQAVANSGGGIHIHADSNAELIDAFRDMARSLELQLID